MARTWTYIATLLNAHPQSMTLVDIAASGPYAESTRIRMTFPGASFAVGGGGYTETTGADETEDYARFHAPGASLDLPEWRARGYGFILYAGAALATEFLPIGDRTRPDENLLGIYSDGHRSPEAACLWARLQCQRQGYRIRGGASLEVDCAIRSKCRSVADQIDAPDEPAGTADVLRASRIRNAGIVVNLAEENDRSYEKASLDLVLNVRLDPEVSAPGGWPEVVTAIAGTIRKNYGEAAAHKFLSRSDVKVAAGLGGLRTSKPPALSARSRKLQQELFVGAP